MLYIYKNAGKFWINPRTYMNMQFIFFCNCFNEVVRFCTVSCAVYLSNIKYYYYCSFSQSTFLLPKQTAPWRFTALRFYADLPGHTKVPLPALSPTMETGKIVSWAKKEGDKLNEGDLLCEIETDKATMGFETPEEGYLAKIIVQAGTKDVKIGALVCIIVPEEGDVAAFKDYQPEAEPAAAPAAPAAAPTPPPPVAAATPPATPPPVPPPAAAPPIAPCAPAGPGARVYASPLAKKLARESGVELSGTGSGIHGSITAKDLAAMKGRISPMAEGIAQAHAERKGKVCFKDPENSSSNICVSVRLHTNYMIAKPYDACW